MSATNEVITTNGGGAVLNSGPINFSTGHLKLNGTTLENTFQPILGFTAVPTTRTVNGHALSGNIVVTATDLGLATVATSGSYNSLINLPTLGSLAALSTITTAQITDGTIVNGDISDSAAIALSKLATNPLARANHTGTQAWSTLTATPTTLAGVAYVVAKKSSSASMAKYVRNFAAVNNAGTSTLRQSETIGTDYEDNASCDFAITVSDANDALVFTCTGITSETWRWTIWVGDVEVSN